MAQVRKFEKGGNSKPSYGRIIINGNVVNDKVDSKFLLERIGNTEMATKLGAYADSGGDIHIVKNPDGSTSLLTGDVSVLSDKSRANKAQTRFGRAFENRATRNDRSEIERIAGLDFSPNTTTYKFDEIVLKEDKDGNILKDEDYYKFLKRYEMLNGLETSGIDFNRDKLDFVGKNHTWDSLRHSIKTSPLNSDIGSWTESDIERALDLNVKRQKYQPKENGKSYDPNDLNKDGTVSEEEKAIVANKKKYTDAGLDYDKHGQYITFDADGNMVITPLFSQKFGNNNSAYNEFWRKSSSWRPEDDWLYGFSRYGNRLYKTSDVETEGSELHKLLSNAGFYNMNLSDNFSGANSILNYLWDTKDDWNTYNSETSYWDPGLEGDLNGMKYRSGNGLYTIAGMPEGSQILEYYNPSGSRDAWGRPQDYMYGLFDANGNFIKNVDKSQLSRINGGQQLAFNGIVDRIYNPESKTYHGRIQRTYTGDSDDIYVKTYWQPGGDMIVEMSDFNKWNQLGNGKQAFKLPKELADVINRNPEFWNNLLKSSSRERFIATLRDAVSSQLSEFIPLDVAGYSTRDNWSFGKKENDLGFSEDDKRLYMDLMAKLGKRNGMSTHDRERAYLMPLYRPVESKQKGGLIGTTVADDRTPKVIKVDDVKDINRAAGTENGGILWDSLTSADKLQLASITADLAGLGLTMAPGVGNVAGSIAGIGGTAAQFAADVKRDGLDWGDAGAALVGLGLDLATLIPGAGSAAKLGKISKGIAKIAPVIKGVLLGIGAIDGVKGLSNILKGNYSIDDFRSVANGLSAAVGIGRKVGDINASKLKKPVEVEPIKPKTADDFKKDYIDDFVKRNPSSTKYNDGDVEWYDRSSGKITDYDKAAEGLKGYTNPETNEAFKLKEGIQKVKAAWDKVAAGSKNLATGIWHSKNNPFSDNFRWRSTNRTLGDTPEEIAAAFQANPHAAARLANLSEDVAQELRSIGYDVTPNNFVRATIEKKPVAVEDPVAPSPRSTDPVTPVESSSIAPENTINIPRGTFDDSELLEVVSGNNYPLVVAPQTSIVRLNGLRRWIPRRNSGILTSHWQWNPYSTPRILTTGNRPIRLMLPEWTGRYSLPEGSTRYLLPAPPTGTQFSLFKKGGILKAQKGDKAGVAHGGKDFKQINLELPVLNELKSINGYLGRSRSAKAIKESLEESRYNNVIQQYDYLSTVTGLSSLEQKHNAEKHAINDAYAKMPQTSDYNALLAMANSRAEKVVQAERAHGLDVANLLNNNTLQRLNQINTDKKELASILNDQRRRDAAIRSGLKQVDVSKIEGDTLQNEAQLNQLHQYLNQDQKLKDAATRAEKEMSINDWYLKEKEKIQKEIDADKEESKLGNDYYSNDRYTPFSNRLRDLELLRRNKLIASGIESVMSPLTGKYYSVNIPTSTTPMSHDTTITFKKGGKTYGRNAGRSTEELNHARILKNIESDNKRMLQLNKNILEMLKLILK